MAWAWLFVCFLTVLRSEVVPTEEQTYSWISENLQYQMFSVMSGGNVHFRSDNPSNFTGLTVCLRVLTEQQSYSIQLTVENQTNVVRLEVSKFSYILYVNDRVSFDRFFMVPAYQEQWPWKNRCFTWDSSSGMAQLWSDGKMSVRKGTITRQVFSGLAELTFEQFEGQVSDVYVWDRVLTSHDLFNFFYSFNIPYGSILDWREIQYSTSGYTVLEPNFIKPDFAKSTTNKKQKSGQKLKRNRGQRREKRKKITQ